MLSIMRRHSGWGLKVLLGIIIVSFVLFFGYSTIQNQRGATNGTAFRIGKERIPQARYDFYLKQMMESFRSKMKEGEIPDFMINMIKNQAQRQITMTVMTEQFANQMGFSVSDAELADVITKEKDFDPVAYKSFLQRFYQQNGFSYEDLLRDELLIQKFQNWAERVEQTTPPPEAPQWTFEVTTIGKDKKEEKGKVGPIGLSQRSQLASGQLTLAEALATFSLQPGQTLAQPIVKGEKSYRIKMVEKKKPTVPATANANAKILPRVRLLDLWFEKFAKATPVKTYLPKENL